jgi:lipoprotein-anchoring transpeptidase ErfK/SrfK
VRIAGVDVSGMRPDLARRLVHRRFDRAIRFSYSERRWKVSTWLLAGSAAFELAVDRALTSPPGARVRLPVSVERDWVEHYVDYLARAFYRAPVNAKQMGLRGLRPYISPARYGIRVRKGVMIARITRNLLEQRRVPIKLATAPVAPAKLRSDFGAEIVIRRLSNRLYVYKAGKFWRSFRVATGSPYYPTPTGDFTIVDKQRWPAWYPPNSPWAKGLKPIPPGPNNPLGSRWMGLSFYGVGIHGTPNPSSIGYSASHGCIRMHIPEAEWLFERVGLGTRVYIVDA